MFNSEELKKVHAILAMDTYIRFDGSQLEVPMGGEVVSIAPTVPMPGPPFGDFHGFAATTYRIGGELIIAYCGTNGNVIDDVITGMPWDSAVGQQVTEAMAYYRQMADYAEDNGLTVSLTGHSLGGGLAGLIGSLFGLRATIFDSIAYVAAATEIYNEAQFPGGYWFETAYGSDPTKLVPPDNSEVLSEYVDGEAVVHLFGERPNSEKFILPGGEVFTFYDPNARHDMALLNIVREAEIQNPIFWAAGGGNVLRYLFSDDVADRVGFSSAIKYERDGAALTMRQAIAHSEFSDGPAGLGALDGLLSDAFDIGRAKEDGLDGYVLDQFGKISTAFAGLVALEERNEDNGILTHAPDVVVIDMSDEKWGDEQLRDDFAAPLVQRFERWAALNGAWEEARDVISDSLDSFGFLLSDGAYAGTLLSVVNAGTIAYVGTGFADEITGSDAGEIVVGGKTRDGEQAGITVRGMGGDDILVGTIGVDHLYGGTGANSLYGGAGDDFLYSFDEGYADRDDISGDFLFGGAGNDSYYVTFGNDTWSRRFRVYDAVGNSFNYEALKTVTTIVDTDGKGIIHGSIYDLGSTNPFYDSYQVYGSGVLYWQSYDENRPADQFSGFHHVFVFQEEVDGQLVNSAAFIPGDEYRSISFVIRDFRNGDFGVTLAGYTNERTPVDDVDPTDGTTGDDAFDFGNDDTARVIDGGDGNDSITGGDGADVLIGGAGNDTLYARGGNDQVFGGTGDDLIIAGSGNGDDSYDGGSGRDRIVYSSATSSIVVDLFRGIANGTDIGQDFITAVEDVTGGAGADEITGDSASNELRGGAGNDTIRGAAGDDEYIYARGDGQDVIVEGLGEGTADRLRLLGINGLTQAILVALGQDLQINIAESNAGANDGGTILIKDQLRTDGAYGLEFLADSFGGLWTRQDLLARLSSGSNGPNVITGTAGNDTLNGGAGDDTINGGDGDDTLNGGAGADVLNGGNGNDTMSGGAGGDTFQGGEGTDTVTYASASAAILIDFNQASTTFLGEAAGDTFGSVEAFVGTAFDDTIQIAGQSATIYGGAGDDLLKIWWGPEVTFYGEAGDDTLRGDWGNDHLDGGNDNDTIDGYGGDDTLLGGSGDDRLIGGLGNDTISGGAGTDEYVYNRGDGADIIIEQDAEGAADLLRVNGVNGLTQTILSALGNDVLIQVLESTTGANDGGSILLKDQLRADGDYGVETVIDGLGNVWTKQNIIDFLGGSAQPNTISGTAGDDEIFGTSGDDIINGAGGDDWLVGDAGADVFVFETNSGSDGIADFTPGVDKIEVRNVPGADFSTVMGAAEEWGGNAWIYFSPSDHVVLYGVSIASLGVDDFIFIQDGTGGPQLNVVLGTENADELYGTILGDNLIGMGGDDELHGLGGSDLLEGGAGNDWLVGGAGSDRFAFKPNFGQDGIADFEAGLDKIRIEDHVSLDFQSLMASAEEWGGNSWLHLGTSDTIVVYGVGLSQLTATDFEFA